MSEPDAKILNRILITNDDGVDAPGIEVAEAVAADLANEVWTVAPEHDQSGTSRQISIHNPLRLQQRGERRFAVTGSPADAAVMGLREVLKDAPPDLVLSGVNAGANVSLETGYSGTVGAALTARMVGVPAIALSQAWRTRQDIPWETSRIWLPKVIRALVSSPEWPTPWVPNINVPPFLPDEIAGVAATRQELGQSLDVALEERVDRREKPYWWLSFSRTWHTRDEGSDISVMREKMISVTPLNMSLTADEALDPLAEMLRNC